MILMDGKASIVTSNIGDKIKETVTLTYWSKDCGDETTAKRIKKLFDKIIVDEGGDINGEGNEKED